MTTPNSTFWSLSATRPESPGSKGSQISEYFRTQEEVNERAQELKKLGWKNIHVSKPDYDPSTIEPISDDRIRHFCKESDNLHIKILYGMACSNNERSRYMQTQFARKALKAEMERRGLMEEYLEYRARIAARHG